MGQVLGLAFFVLFMLSGVGLEFIATRRCRRRIDEWVTTQGLRTQSVTRRWFPVSGPWAWSGGRSHRVFGLTATDAQGQSRQGFARIGGGWGGIVADEIDVRW